VNGPVIGWDIGGANIKAARIECAGSDAAIVEQPFALWREPHRLIDMLTGIGRRLGPVPVMAVTMTAELADCFATKREGVAFVIDAVDRAFPAVDARMYGVDGSFRSPETARERPDLVAAANWMASATVAARAFPNAIFVDVGSTTTDVVPLVRGRVRACGRTDPARLGSGELVYTGALRTPVCAIVRSVWMQGASCRVAAEHFAIAADAHRWLGRITDDEYTCETPDGRGTGREECGARLARMVCADRETVACEDVTTIASTVARAQVRQIAVALRQVIRRLGADSPRDAIVVGCGAFLARAAAAAVCLTVREPSTPAQLFATPAAAVAYLLLEAG
jgi:probable H4MPT-linked C1 transfer pathway protein